MKKDSTHLNPFRNRNHPQFKTEDTDGMTGYFVIPVAEDAWALTIASPGNELMPWEHVSARIGYKKYHGKMAERLPTWDEMCLLKEIFWDNDECVMQLHPKESDYVNQHPLVLHLWKPVGMEIPTPPKVAV
jgi:hypothetical protein